MLASPGGGPGDGEQEGCGSGGGEGPGRAEAAHEKAAERRAQGVGIMTSALRAARTAGRFAVVVADWNPLSDGRGNGYGWLPACR